MLLYHCIVVVCFFLSVRVSVVLLWYIPLRVYYAVMCVSVCISMLLYLSLCVLRRCVSLFLCMLWCCVFPSLRVLLCYALLCISNTQHYSSVYLLFLRVLMFRYYLFRYIFY